MKELAAFTRKEFFHIFRDTRTMLILLAMPVVQIILFGFAISVEIQNINVAVVEPEPCETVRRAVERIDANNYFTVKGVYASYDEAQEMVQRGGADVVLSFAPSFDRRMAAAEEGIIEIAADASNPNNAVWVQMYLGSTLNRHFHDEAHSTASASLITPVTRLLYNPAMVSAYNFVPGIMGLIMLIICSMMTSVSIVREKETGTMEVLLVSPVHPLSIIVAKMIPYFAISCVNLATILLLARYVLGVPMAGNIFALCFISLIYILLSLALGLLISTLVKTQMAAMLCSAMLLMLPVLMLSGMLFPIESQPQAIRWISFFIPARWYISAMRKLMIEGLSINYVWSELCVLAAMTALLIAVALAKFKNRLE